MLNNNTLALSPEPVASADGGTNKSVKTELIML